MTKWMAKTLGPKIRVNSISPGGIKRNNQKDLLDNTKEGALQGWLQRMMY